MLAEALTALASTGGTALVTAMVTDSWESIMGRVARLLGRGDAQQTEAAQERLELSRAALDGLVGTELDRARAEQEIVWRTRLADLLEAHPQAADELTSLIGVIEAQARHSAGPVVQHATAYDQAQQAVLGHGVQNVTFGGQRDPGSQN
jgi:hypothetical protein